MGISFKAKNPELKKMIREDHEKMMQRLYDAEHLLNTTRAGKLLKKGKPFIVVAIDEPYYPQTYRLIRQNEIRKGTWTLDCETEFQKAMSTWYGL